jgi:uncharacterized protein (TIGR02145 family)
MKRIHVLQILVLLFFAITTSAQQGINYKAIVHDENGNALANTPVTVQFTILANGITNVYKEIHHPVTDDKGIILLNIGEGTLISGEFESIDWRSSPHFLKTEINSGDGLTDMGSTEFKSVPYSIHAQTSSGIPDYIDFDGVANGDVLVYDGNVFKPSQFDFYYKDGDGDGYGTEETYLFSPLQPPGHTNIAGDCDDNDPNIFPGAEEICDGLDNDCDGTPDFPGGEADADEDGFRLCEGDCDDDNATIHPGATEICGDGIDQDCDGSDLTCETVEDVDGNVYQTIRIGDQLWMAENLKTTRLSNGSDIPLVVDNSEWQALNSPGYCWYDNDMDSYKETYGALYNLYAVATGQLCPDGWQVPTENEWTELENFLADNGYNYDGTVGGGGQKIAKAMATDYDWMASTNVGAVGNTDYPEKRNLSGFSALPGGQRMANGNFISIGISCKWWCLNVIMPPVPPGYPDRSTDYNSTGVYEFETPPMGGLSIRCVKD